MADLGFGAGRTPYDVLELPAGPAATKDEIKKAYRRLAAVKHPDKNKGNPAATAEFVELKKAYDALTDEAARGALDDFVRASAAKKERDAAQGEKRRKMREELETRERRATEERSEEATARSRLKAELERLRQRAADEQRRAAEAAAAAAAAAAGPSGQQEPGGGGAEMAEQLARTLKVTWDAAAGDYGSDALRTALGAHGGRVKAVVLRQRKRASRGSALVVMATREDALRAAQSVCGNLTNPLLVVPLSREAPQDELLPPASVQGARAAAAAAPPPQHPQWQQQAFPAAALRQATPLFPGAAPPPAGSSSGARAPLFPVAGTSSFPGARPPLFPGAASAAAAFGAFAPSSFPGASASSFPGAPAASASSFPGAPAAAAAPLSGAEGAVLEKLRRAAERERLLAQIARDEGGGEGG